MAIAFGTGRRLLADGVTEADFGLRVSLNAICAPSGASGSWDAARIRSVDARRVGANTIATRRQASRLSPFETFDIDVQQDFMRSVTGHPVNDAWGGRISGSEACRVTAPITLGELAPLCIWLEETYRQGHYRRHFSWVDNVRPITDRATVDRLDRAVVRTLRAARSHSAREANLELTPPGITDWEGIQDFRFSIEADKPIDDPSLASFERAMRDSGKWVSIEVDDLKRAALLANYEDGSSVRWAIYKCLSGELRVGGHTYLIDEGVYYLVSDDYLGELDTYVAQITRWNTPLPEWPTQESVPAGETANENYYNRRAAESLPRCYLFGQQTSKAFQPNRTDRSVRSADSRRLLRSR